MNERKKNITIYIFLLISFIAFSVYVFNRKINNETKTNNTNIKINSETKTNNEVTKIEKNDNEVGSEYKTEIIKTVNTFINSYHLIDNKNPIENFEKAKDTVVDPLYLDLKNEVLGNSSMNTNGLIYRTIEDINIYDYYFDDESKDINIKVSVKSNWLDENKSIALKNELTKYEFLLTNYNGIWKISNLSMDIY